MTPVCECVRVTLANIHTHVHTCGLRAWSARRGDGQSVWRWGASVASRVCEPPAPWGPAGPAPPASAPDGGLLPAHPRGSVRDPRSPFSASSEGRSCSRSAGLCLCHSHIPFRALADPRPPQGLPLTRLPTLPGAHLCTPTQPRRMKVRESHPAEDAPSSLRAPLSGPALPGEPAPPIQSAWRRGSGKFRGRRGSSPPFRPSNIVAAPDLCSFI